LGRAVLAEVIRRVENLGVEDIYVETDNYRSTARDLYELLGFHPERNILVFRKNYVGEE
jgi:ribosomal protein S18 acetylase RimI-like enzyme